MEAMSEEYKRMWHRMLSKGTEKFSKLIVIILTWSMDVFFLGMSVRICWTYNDPRLVINLRYTLALHFLCSAIRFWISIFGTEVDKDRSQSPFEKIVKYLVYFVLDMFMILSIIRGISGFQYRVKHWRIVKEKLRLRKNLSREEISAWTSICKRNLEDSYFNLVTVFLKTVPMGLLQMSIMLQRNEAVDLCSTYDVIRLVLLGWCIFSSAKSVTDYNCNYMLYLKSIHFLKHFDSNTEMPLQIMQMPTKIHYILNLTFNFILTFHRFHWLSFFLGFSVVMGGVYLVASVIFQFVALELLYGLRVPFEYLTLEISTKSSDLITLWADVFSNFSNHMTQYCLLVINTIELDYRKAWKSVILISVVFPIVNSFMFVFFRFLAPLSVTLLWFFCFESDINGFYDFRKHVVTFITIGSSSSFNEPAGENGSVIMFPCSNSTLKTDSTVLTSFVNFIFGSFTQMLNYFELIKQFMLTWDSLFVLLATCFFSSIVFYMYELAQRSHKTQKFRKQNALQHWHFLIKHFIGMSSGGKKDTKTGARFLIRMMTLTIMDDDELYECRLKILFQWKSYIPNFIAQYFPSIFKDIFNDKYWNDIEKEVVEKRVKSGTGTDDLDKSDKSQQFSSSNFDEISKLLLESERWDGNTLQMNLDDRLLQIFCKCVDERLDEFPPRRIKSMLKMLGFPVQRLNLVHDCFILGNENIELQLYSPFHSILL